MKYSFGFIVVLCIIAAISADCGCPSCSKGNLQIVPSNSNVEVIYKGQPCPCQRALPYQVEIPLNSLPESRRSYEYQVVAPPRPSPPPQRYIYNYQLQVPVPQAPQQRLNGLLARLDRVVLPAPDCRSVNPALATDANNELYSDGNELTPIGNGYTSQTVYSNGGLSSGSYLSGSNYDNYNTLSNSYGLSNNVGVYSSGVSVNGLNAVQQFENNGQISLTPCNGVRGPIVEQLRYYNDNDDTNDYYSRYERSNINSDETDSTDILDNNKEQYIEANVPYIPDSDNIENYSLKNSEYSILEEVPARDTVRNYETDYNDYDDDDEIDNADKTIYNRNYEYTRENLNYDDESTSDENNIPYLSKVYSAVETDDLRPQNFYTEALTVDNAYNTVDNSNVDTDLLYKLYLEYLEQQNENTNQFRRRRRDLTTPEKTTETAFKELLAYFNDNRGDCSVPLENRNINLTVDNNEEDSTEQSMTTNDVYSTTNHYTDTTTESLIPTTTITTQTDNSTPEPNSVKQEQMKDLVRLFEKYNKIKEINNNNSPVSIHKFFANYPQAVKLINNIGGRNKVSRDTHYFDGNQNMIDITSQYFQPPMCPTIQNLLKHPKYNAKQMTDTGILQFLPELKAKQQQIESQQTYQPSARELYQQRVFDINGLDMGPVTRKPRSYAVSPRPVFGTRFLPKTQLLSSAYPLRKMNKAGDLNLQRARESEENIEDNMYMRSEMLQNVNQFSTDTSELFGNNRNTKMQANYDMSSGEIETNHKEDSTTLYKAIDLKQKLREKQRQNYDEDSELYKKYLEIPALQKQENKYNKYFRIPEFARLNINRADELSSPIDLDIMKLQKPEIIVPKMNENEESLYDIERDIQQKEPIYAAGSMIPPGAVMLPPGQKCKRHNTPYCSCNTKCLGKSYSPKVQFFNSITKNPLKFTKINHMYDQGFGENFSNYASLKLKREENIGTSSLNDQVIPIDNLPVKQTLDQFEENESNIDVNSSGELSDTESIERYERTISFILSKLRNSRLLNYIRRKYNDRLARRLNGVVRNMDAINTLNAISSTNNVETSFNTDVNIGLQSTQNALRESTIDYTNRFDISSNVNRFNNYNTVIKSNPKIVYDHLGHKYVEINGFRRLIRPNIQKQVEIQTINRPAPCVETVDILTNNIQSDCSQNNYQNNLESEIIVETNDILQREPVYKTETIEIIKPEQHIYYPQEKYIIQQTKVDQVSRPIITEEIKLSENIDTGCQNNNQIVIEQGREYIQRRPCQQQQQEQIIEKIVTEENRNGDKVVVDEKIIKNSSGEREIIKSIEIDERQQIVPERKIEIIEEKTIQQQPKEIVITQTIEQPQQRENANIEIKETIKKYQIPVINPVCTHPNCEHHQQKQIIESTNQNQQTIIENQTNAINEYQKLQQLQQFANYLHLLQNQQQQQSTNTNVDVNSQQLLSNLIANQQHSSITQSNQNQLLNNLLLNRLRLNNAAQNVQPTGNIKTFVKNSHSSEQLTDINLHKSSNEVNNLGLITNNLPLNHINTQNLAINSNHLANNNLNSHNLALNSNHLVNSNLNSHHLANNHLNSQNLAINSNILTNNNLNNQNLATNYLRTNNNLNAVHNLGVNSNNHLLHNQRNLNLDLQKHISRSSEETDFDIHKNLNLDILKQQASLNNIKNFDLNLHHSNNVLLPNSLSSLGSNNIATNTNNAHLLNGNNLHYLNNFDLHNHFNSFLNKRNIDTEAQHNLDNCQLNPDHSEHDHSVTNSNST